MKITITIEDQENGQVKVDSKPHMKTLLAMARSPSRDHDLTPAAGYALCALAKIIKDSQEQVKEQVKAKFDAGIIPALPSKRNMFS